MLTTFLIGLPVWPFHSPLRILLAEVGHPVEDLVDIGDDVAGRRRSATGPSGHPQGHMEHRAVLGDVDPLPREHRLGPLAEAGVRGEADEQSSVSSVTRFLE